MQFLPDGTFAIEDKAALQVPEPNSGEGLSATLPGPGFQGNVETFDTSPYLDDGGLHIRDTGALQVADRNGWTNEPGFGGGFGGFEPPILGDTALGSSWGWGDSGLITETWMQTVAQDAHDWEKVGKSWDWIGGCCAECLLQTGTDFQADSSIAYVSIGWPVGAIGAGLSHASHLAGGLPLPSSFLLLPCYCPCKEGQKDVTDQVNKMINKLIDSGCKTADGKPDSPSVIEALQTELLSSRNPMTGIENDIEVAARKGKLPANVCHPGSLKYGLVASALKVCGVCVGSDKIGHFFEEGLFYSEVAAAVREKKENLPNVDGARVARALGYLLEGLDPTEFDIKLTEEEKAYIRSTKFEINFAGNRVPLRAGKNFGFFSDSPWLPDKENYPEGLKSLYGGPEGGSLADIAANEAGRTFWDRVMADPKRFCNDRKKKPFDICSFVDKSWDEGQNSRKKCEENPPGWIL